MEGIKHNFAFIADQHDSSVINQQPLPGSQISQITLPVYTPGFNHIMPMTGLDFLIGVPEVVIHQTVEDCKLLKN